jgi:hypothetical protein
MDPTPDNNGFQDASKTTATEMNTQPMQPVTTTGTTPGGPVAKKSNKLLIIILSIVGGLVVIGALIAAFFMMSGVSRQDYTTASGAVRDMRKAYNDMTGTYISQYSTENEIKRGVASIKESKGEFDAKYKELSDLKAVKNDTEVKDVFKKLQDKKPKFDSAVSTALESYEKVIPVLTSIKSTSSSDDALRSLGTAQKSLEELDLNAEMNKEFADKLAGQLKKVVDAANALKSSTTYDSNAYSNYYDLVSDMSDTITNWQKDMRNLVDDADLADEINDLSSLLTQKTFDS